MKLDRIFDDLDVSAAPFALCEFRGRCSLGLTGQGGAVLHYVLAGRGQVRFERRAPEPIEQGMLVLTPAYMSHMLISESGEGGSIPECRPAELELESHRIEGAGEGGLVALCANVRVSLRGVGGVIDLLREPIVERVAPEGAAGSAMTSLLEELAAPRLGGRAMIRAILLQCLISLLRERLMARDPALAWMTALTDERLWSALQLMLDRPAGSHTVESLAEAAGMSRSTFAQHFAEAYGSGPMSLLRDLRMQMAASMLARSSLPVKRIAEMCGLGGRSHFTRAFAKAFGQAPGEYRRASREQARASL